MNRLAILASLLLVMNTSVRAEQIVALTASNQLVTFDSATPGSLISTVAISGLLSGDALVGIDLRPSNNTLYGFAVGAVAGGPASGVGKVYSFNLATGAATLAATLSADPTDATPPTPYASTSGTYFGVDFNPVADRLRVVSDTGQSLRINVATGLTQLDGALAYAAADANAGTTPQVFASAYTNSVAGAATTALYNLDGAIGTLVTQAPPNDGTLNTVALVDAIVSPDSAFDISGQTGTAFVVLDGSTLNTINLSTGAINQLGAIGALSSIADIAVLAALVPEPSSALILFASLSVFAIRARL